MKSLKVIIFIAIGLIVGGFFFHENYEVPVLMYHHVGNPTIKEVNVTTQSFERQMEFLKVHKYNVIPLEELFRLIKAKQTVPPKTVVITFDDGFYDNFDYAFPILRRMNLPATIFMVTDKINEEGWLSEEDLKILDASGVTIGSHTATHMHLPHHTELEVEEELVRSKKRLEELLGHPITLFSYPAGGLTETHKKTVEETGYMGAVTTNWGTEPLDPYAVRRIKISESSGNLFNFWIKLTGLYHLGKKRIPIPA